MPRAVVGYDVKIFLPSPPNYVTRSPGHHYFENSLKKGHPNSEFRSPGKSARCRRVVYLFVRYVSYFPKIILSSFKRELTTLGRKLNQSVSDGYNASAKTTVWCSGDMNQSMSHSVFGQFVTKRDRSLIIVRDLWTGGRRR